jgi:hypothetical protein
MANGDTLLVFDALANSAPASDFATLDVRGDFLVLDFDPTASEQAQFVASVPSHYKGGNLEVRITGTSTSATTGNAKLQIELTRIAAGDNLDALPAADASGELIVAAPATSGVLQTGDFDPLAVADLVPGDLLRVQITRLAVDVEDTMTGDWELVALELREVA